jgi:predicted metal-binding membrane protein
MNKASHDAAPFPSVAPAASTIASLPRRDKILILGCIILITALAWVYLFHVERQMSSAVAQSNMMAAMGMAVNAPWTAADLLATFAMWAVMMVGMMGPSAAPMILLFGAAQAKRRGPGASIAAGIFGLSYIVVWTAFSAGAALAQWALHEAALLSAAMAVSSPRLGGAVLIAAGLYQLTPWKNKCLTHCRSPLSFLMTHWRDGKWGAFEMGARHGAYCLGCCWALMIVLFAVGVMNLVWVAVLAAFVLLEKIGPQGALVARLSGAALIVLGVVTLA